MNYTLFYKMIKEANPVNIAARQVGPKPAPAAAPASAKNSASTSPPTPATTPPVQPITLPGRYKGPPTTPLTPDTTPNTNIDQTQGGSLNLEMTPDLSLRTNLTRLTSPKAGGMQLETPTVDQLTKRWVDEKEQFYRNKADKYPQYANWTVSPQTREHLRQQAQDMLLNDRERARQIWARGPYNPQTDVYRDEAFRYGTDQGWKRLKNEQAKAKEEAAKQNAPMQNPVASAAVGNPRQYDYSITGAQQFVRDWVRRYGNPASSMQLQSRFSNDFAHALPGFYQVPPGSTMWLEFSKDMRQKGLDPLGTMRSSIDNGYFDDPDAPAATSFEDMLKWYRKDLAQYGWAHSSTPEGQARIARANRYGRNLYDSHPAQSFQEDAYNRGINPYGNMANIVRDAYLDWGDNYILDNLKLN